MNENFDSKKFTRLLLEIAQKEGILNLNVTKIQKILFIIYGYYLTKNINIIDERPQAWPYGPVFPNSKKEVSKLYDSNPDNDNILDSNINLNNDDLEIIRKILKKFSVYSAGVLSEWSHREGGPWYRTTKMPGFTWSNKISDDFIKEYFIKYPLKI